MDHLTRIAELEEQVRKLARARRLSGAVLASRRRRQRAATADGEASPAPIPEPHAGSGGDTGASDSDSDSDEEEQLEDESELMAEYERHQCVLVCKCSPFFAMHCIE